MNINHSSFQGITLFENKVAEWFNAPYGVAVDCCTHGLELCLRLLNTKEIIVPKHTYLSIPMLSDKLDIKRVWTSQEWSKYYYITDNIIDAAVLWEQNSYISGTFMVLSFQFKKHLNLGRGGMILTDNKEAAEQLRKMTYDGRTFDKPWAEQDIETIGYHYYMTPETAEIGVSKLQDAISRKPKIRSYKDYPELTKMKIFNE